MIESIEEGVGKELDARVYSIECIIIYLIRHCLLSKKKKKKESILTSLNQILHRPLLIGGQGR